MKAISTLLCLAATVAPSLAAVNLATSASYGALAVEGITNTGASLVTGNIGTTGRAITGFPPGVFTGTSGAGTAAVVQARADALAAYTAIQAMVSTASLPAVVGSGQVLEAGTYKFSRGASLVGNITLSGPGTFCFQVPAVLIAEAGSSVILANGAVASDVFWASGNTATIAPGASFAGSILADNTITVGAAATIEGGLYGAEAISLSDNTIGL